MSDLSQFSDDEIMQMLSAPQPAQEGVSAMSDEQLMQAISLAEPSAQSAQPNPQAGWLEKNVFNKPQPFSGDILPISRKEPGGPVEFDSDAGFIGGIKRAVQLPEQVLDGKVNPMSPEGMDRSLEAAMVMSPMSAASRGAGGLLAPKSSYRKMAKEAPTRKALEDATDAGYKQARGLGAEYTPKSIKTWADDTARALDQEGYIAENYPEIHALLGKLRNPPENASSITLESIDAVYRQLGKLAGSPDTAKASAAGMVQKGLDDFHASLSPSALVAGTVTPEKAANILKNARGNAAAGFRSDRVTGLEETSARRTAAANSGRNADNNIRQRLTSLIESRKGSRGLSREEVKAIDDIIYGRPTKNAARYFGNLLGGGGGLGQAMLSGATGVGGAAAFGPGGAALAMVPPVLGAIGRSTANQMTKRELKALDGLIRSRSPLAESMPGGSTTYQPGLLQGAGETTIRGLLAPKSKKGFDLGWI